MAPDPFFKSVLELSEDSFVIIDFFPSSIFTLDVNHVNPLNFKMHCSNNYVILLDFIFGAIFS